MFAVELVILAVCLPGGWWAATHGPPPLEASVTGRVATWLVGGLCALAAAIAGLNIYASGYLLNELHQAHDRLNLDLQAFVVHRAIVATMRSTVFYVMVIVGLAAVIYLLAPASEEALD
jgi:hypothetical protein